MIASAASDNPVERIRHNLVGLRMPRALEALEAVIHQLEHGQVGAIEAIDILLAASGKDDAIQKNVMPSRRHL